MGDDIDSRIRETLEDSSSLDWEAEWRREVILSVLDLCKEFDSASDGEDTLWFCADEIRSRIDQTLKQQGVQEYRRGGASDGQRRSTDQGETS